MLSEKKIKQILKQAEDGQKTFHPLDIAAIAKLALIGREFLKLSEGKPNGTNH